MNGVVCVRHRAWMGGGGAAGEHGRGVDPAQLPLSPGERAHLAGLTVPKRREEWLLGRMTARAAVLALLDRAGLERPLPASMEVVSDPDGAPRLLWLGGPALPEVRLSLSHQGGWAAAWAAFPEPGVSFGLDLEQVTAREPGLVEQFFTEEERGWIEALEPGSRDWGINVVWSLKEATLKALRVGLRADTRQVRVRAVHADGRAEVEIDAALAGGASVAEAGWERLEDRVISRVVLEQAG